MGQQPQRSHWLAIRFQAGTRNSRITAVTRLSINKLNAGLWRGADKAVDNAALVV